MMNILPQQYVQRENWSPEECTGDAGCQAVTQISKEEREIPQGISNSPLLKTMTVVSCCLLGVILLWKVCLLCIMPGIEARELANVAAIQHCREHTFDILEFYPRNIYLYGPLQAYILSFLPSGNDLLSNRLFSVLCMLISYIPLIVVMRRIGRKLRKNSGSYIIYTLLGCCYLFPLVFELPYTAGTPNFLGLLFSNCVLLICTCRFSGRYVVAGLLLLCCFLTKQYFLAAAVYVVNYCLLFEPFKNAVRHIAITGIVALACCTLCFSSDQVLYAFAHHSNAATCTMQTALRKFVQYMCCVLPMVAPAALIAYKNAVTRIKRYGWQETARVFTRHTKGRLCFFCFLNVLITIFILAKVGGHAGALGLMYFTQLLTPPLLLLCFILLILDENRGSARILFAVTIPVSFSLPLVFINREIIAIKTQSTALSVYASDISGNEDIRGSAFTSFYDAAHGRLIYENGQQQYMHTLTAPEFCPEIFFHRLAPYQSINNSYLKQLENDIHQGKWSIIYTDNCSYMPESAKNELVQHYTLSNTYPFTFTLLMKGNLNRWVRKKE